MKLSEKIKQMRELANMSQEQFAQQLDVNQSVVSLWECGKAEPTAINLLKLARFNQSSVDDLLDNIVPFSNSISPKLLNVINILTLEEQQYLALFLESILSK